jgi:hypothetical protein
VVFLERVSPALEQVDSSSGAVGNAVNRAIAELATIIAGAPAERRMREAWLDRPWSAHEADDIPYIETLADEGRRGFVAGFDNGFAYARL